MSRCRDELQALRDKANELEIKIDKEINMLKAAVEARSLLPPLCGHCSARSSAHPAWLAMCKLKLACLPSQITKNETIKYSLGMMLAFATAGLGAGESSSCVDDDMCSVAVLVWFAKSTSCSVIKLTNCMHNLTSRRAGNGP